MIGLALAAVLVLPAAGDDEPKPTPTIAEAVEGLEALDGFLPLYWDEAKGRLLLEIGRFDEELLYQVGLSTGVGSNPIGLDRGQLGSTHLVLFRRTGPKVLMIEPNTRYRALTDRPAERKAVEESFARSVLAGFKVEAEEDGRVLVDATSFFLRDAHGVARQLKQADQGSYKLDEARSALLRENVRNFPRNTEVEALLTFATDDRPGRLVAEAAPTAEAIATVQHHSFVELPKIGEGYTPRKLDPRVGVFAIDFYDYATPLTSPIEAHWICRFRLAKEDPEAEVSRPVEPIRYYVDPGAPEPIRAALIEGASWWAEAFEAAGFRDAFRVEVLPEGVDPMDLRYNVIRWVHRSTRGWSYGDTVVDPRTGEILKGAVTLDSLRARQDALIGDGLAPATSAACGCGMILPPGPEYLAAADPEADVEAMVLARIRQLSAHEVGHTLGLAHNFAASTYGRGSVMDYPAPLVAIEGGKLDLSAAYAVGIGAYDKFAITYGYAQFPPDADEAAELDKIVRRGVDDGLLFLSDADARPDGAAHPLAALWDNGDDPIAALGHEMEVRRIGLERFGLENLEEGRPLSELEAKLLPLYLHHRYQLRAAAKSLGGAYYTNAVKSAGGTVPATPIEMVGADRQRAALGAVLATLDPEVLTLPDRILDLIPPIAFGFDFGTAERFDGSTGRVFDPIAAATTAADLAVSELLQRDRAARLDAFHARDPENPDFTEVTVALVEATWDRPEPEDSRQGAVLRAVQWLTLNRLIELASDERATPGVRAVATVTLANILSSLPGGGSRAWIDHFAAARREIGRFLSRPDPPHRRQEPRPAPPGDPIGAR